MSVYFIFCLVMFVIGLALLGVGFLTRGKLSPTASAWLILIGVVLAMVFMNLCLVQMLLSANG